jgi:hypothetical protein
MTFSCHIYRQNVSCYTQDLVHEPENQIETRGRKWRERRGSNLVYKIFTNS